MMKQFLFISQILFFAVSSSYSQTLTIESGSVSNGEQICVSIFGDNVETLISAQHSFHYNPDHLDFTGVQNFNMSSQVPNNIFSEPYDGFVTFSWIADDLLNGFEVEDGETLYQICFQAIQDDVSTNVFISNSPTPVEISNVDGELVTLDFVPAEITIGAGGVFVDPIVFIPDPVFKSDILSKSYDLNNDGELQESEAKGIFSLSSVDLDIETLTGVETFENLSTLKVYNNNLTSLDLSENTNLKVLECQGNMISDLQLGGELEFLNCSNNNLESMILASTPFLRILLCRGNQLTYLETSSLISLEGLDASFNNLSSIFLDNNVSLINLDLSDNDLDTLNITENEDLKYFDCSNNLIPSLDLSQNSLLIEAYLSQNMLSSLDFTANPDLQKLYCGDNNISLLFLEANDELKTLSCRNNNIASLFLEGKEHLFTLDCSGNLLPAINLSDCVDLGLLDCSSNSIANLDLSSNPNISFLDCSENEISGLDLTGLSNLWEFNCSGNIITSLDLESNGILEKLDASSNQIVDADISSNPTLLEIDFSDNQLISLNLRNGSNADQVDFSGNENLNAVCVDDNELIFIDSLVDSYGYTACSVYTDCSLLNSTEESVAASAFSLFPVPTAEFLNLVTEEEIIEIEVIDSKGLLKMGLSPARGDRTIQFSVEDLQSGVYLIRIQTEKEIYSRSFIKS